MFRLAEHFTSRGLGYTVYAIERLALDVAVERLFGVVLPVAGGFIAQRRDGGSPAGPVVNPKPYGPVVETVAEAVAQLRSPPSQVEVVPALVVVP